MKHTCIWLLSLMHKKHIRMLQHHVLDVQIKQQINTMVLSFTLDTKKAVMLKENSTYTAVKIMHTHKL